MSPAANPVGNRLLSLICLCLTLLSSVPCIAAPAPAAMNQAAMTAHCAPCCKSTPASVTRLCCLAHPQPAQLAPSTSSNQDFRWVGLAEVYPGKPRVLRVADAVEPPRPVRPPLLHPVLRI